jgi:hypothetical protein
MLCENTVKGVFLIGHYILKNMLNIDLFIWQHALYIIMNNRLFVLNYILEAHRQTPMLSI